MNVLAHNLPAMFTDRELNVNTKQKTKSIEKLSSGYRINRAADDAAGLAISEKLRKMIRGLNQGEENIQDGISLCQVADGALDEVTQILQRARELSIKAYNGTNSDGDRKIIQEEIDQIFQEIDRVRETAEFNEIPLLQGDPITFSTYTDVIENRTLMSETVRMKQELPSWIRINDQTREQVKTPIQGTSPTQYTYNFKVEEHAQYNQKQDIKDSDLMYVKYPSNSATPTHIYYGPDVGDSTIYTGATAQWAGNVLKDQAGNPIGNAANWTDTLADNPTAKIDFGELAKTTDSNSLYQNLFSLIGTQIGFPCGTCNGNIEGIRFSANEFDLTVNEFNNISGIAFPFFNEINLSKTPFEYNGVTYNGYFSAINELQKSNASPSAVQALADAIAKNLAETVYTTLSETMGGHFDRVAWFEDNGAKSDYALIVYDYRDINKLGSEYAADTAIINTSAVLTGTSKYYHVSTEEQTYSVLARRPIQIIASGEVYDSIPIHLPDISLAKLNLIGYDITTYTMEVTYGDISEADKAAYEAAMRAYEEEYSKYQEECKKIDQEYAKELNKYSSEWNEWYRDNVKIVIKYEEQEFRELETPAQYGYDENGERIQISEPIFVTVKKMVEIKDTVITNPNLEPKRPTPPQKPARPRQPDKPRPKMTMTRRYNPSSVKILDDAIAKVSAARADIGARQNRLEHAYAYDCNAEENLQASESRIRDTDMASEMVKYTRHNILEQFGNSLLAQANHGKDRIIELLEQ